MSRSSFLLCVWVSAPVAFESAPTLRVCWRVGNRAGLWVSENFCVIGAWIGLVRGVSVSFLGCGLIFCVYSEKCSGAFGGL